MKFERGDLVVWHRWDNVVEGPLIVLEHHKSTGLYNTLDTASGKRGFMHPDQLKKVDG